MVLLLQLNAELPELFPWHDRRLYVFACKRKTCRRKIGSVRAVRGARVWGNEGHEPDRKNAVAVEKQQATEPKQPAPPEKEKPGLGSALFGSSGGLLGGDANPFSSNANPFSISTSSNRNGNPFSSAPGQQSEGQAASPSPLLESSTKQQQQQQQDLSKTFAETLSLDHKHKDEKASQSKQKTALEKRPPQEPWPDATSQPSPYPTLWLADADYETLDPTPPASQIPENVRMEDADAPETISALDREAFESSMDPTFQKFADRLAQNPDQVIRYEFGGEPLLYTKVDAVGKMFSGTQNAMPPCANCGAKRTFEVQLTPNAIAELEADDMGLEGMEWGTIIVGVCEKDCLPGYVRRDEAGYLEEWVGVQWEEICAE